MLAITNKLVVIINSLKIPKIYENFTIWNEISCTKLQLPPEPLTRGLPLPDPRSVCPLSSTEFVEHPPPRKKILGKPLVCVTIVNIKHGPFTFISNEGDFKIIPTQLKLKSRANIPKLEDRRLHWSTHKLIRHFVKTLKITPRRLVMFRKKFIT